MTREEAWRLATAGRLLFRLDALRAVVVHHSATSRDASYEAIVQGHTAPKPQGNAWPMIGYHAVILGDGTLAPGRPIPVAGAHAPGRNLDTLGLCIVGDNTVPEHRWSPAQLRAARRWLDALDQVAPGLELLVHRDIKATLCPGLTRDAVRMLLGR